MTAVFCPALSDSAGRRVVNHRILGTGQRAREQLLSATLPAIREPALAHGHGHTRERRLRGAALHATANVTLSPAAPTHGHRHSQRLQLRPSALLRPPGAGREGEAPLRALPARPAAGRAPGARPAPAAGAARGCSFATRTQRTSALNKGCRTDAAAQLGFYLLHFYF